MTSAWNDRSGSSGRANPSAKIRWVERTRRVLHDRRGRISSSGPRILQAGPRRRRPRPDVPARRSPGRGAAPARLPGRPVRGPPALHPATRSSTAPDASRSLSNRYGSPKPVAATHGASTRRSGLAFAGCRRPARLFRRRGNDDGQSVRTGSAVLGFCGSGFVPRCCGSVVLSSLAKLRPARNVAPGTARRTRHSAQNLEPQNLRTAVSHAETQAARSSQLPYA